MFNLLTTGSPKTSKGEKLGWLTGILYMIPADLAGIMNRAGKVISLCPNWSAGCKASCLVSAGRAGMGRALLPNGLPDNAIIRARQRRTELYLSDRESFIAQLCEDVDRLVRTAERKGMRAALRFNGTSDLPHWRLPRYGAMIESLVKSGRLVTYDYTKTPKYLKSAPSWHDLTLSRSETNADSIGAALASGFKVAVVFDRELPNSFLGYPVVSGDEHDLTFLHQGPIVLGLVAKGRAKKDNTGFVVRGGDQCK